MDVKQLLRESDFHFNKQFGQNFLTDGDVLSAIASDAEINGDDVLEIGAGAGTLTKALSRCAGKVVSYEIDRRLEPILAQTLEGANNVSVNFGDVMKCTTPSIEKQFDGEYRLVANIPYYITTPLIMKFVEEGEKVKSLTLTIQKEVADRLTATPKTKDYGAITVGVDAVATAKVTRVLTRDLFYPAPNVDSAVVHIVMDRHKFDIKDSTVFRKTVKCAFAMRRKTLVNNLINGMNMNRVQAEKVLEECGFDRNVRGEELSTADYVKLANYLTK